MHREWTPRLIHRLHKAKCTIVNSWKIFHQDPPNDSSVRLADDIRPQILSRPSLGLFYLPWTTLPPVSLEPRKLQLTQVLLLILVSSIGTRSQIHWPEPQCQRVRFTCTLLIYSGSSSFLGLIDLPASVYVPSSDLAPLNFGLPGPLYAEQSTEKVYNPPLLDDLGSLEDFSLLQFPIPTTLPPDVSTPPASFCSDNSYISPEMDWSAITDFINQFSSFSAESSSAPSPSSTIDAAPSTPENPIGSLLPPPSHEVNKPISILDPSIPPSAFLPAEPGIFTDDGSSMWSLLCGLS